MVLGQQEVEACREAFDAFGKWTAFWLPVSCSRRILNAADDCSVPDTNNSGEIDAWELRDILKGLGRNPSDEELFELISLVDTNMSGTIDFAEFLAV